MTTALQSFASLIRAAGHQRRLMVLWLDDRYFLERGGTLVHAVDTHVIVLYVQPDRSVTLEHWEGYAEMFPDDDRFLSQALEGALARHIFYSLEHDQPLLVLPPMEQEIGRVFNAINRHVHSEQVKARDELKDLPRLVRFLDQEEGQRALLARLDSEAPTLWKLLKGHTRPLRGDGPAPESLQKSTDRTPGIRTGEDWVSNPELRHAMEPSERFADRVGFIELRDAWYTGLLTSKSASRSRVSIYGDATALARLEWLNSRQLDQARFRLVLITGDSAIHRAAHAYTPSEEVHCFGDLYLRHPLAYLAEPGSTVAGVSADPGKRRVEVARLARYLPRGVLFPRYELPGGIGRITQHGRRVAPRTRCPRVRDPPRNCRGV